MSPYKRSFVESLKARLDLTLTSLIGALSSALTMVRPHVTWFIRVLTSRLAIALATFLTLLETTIRLLETTIRLVSIVRSIL